jgi:hypothetical protein
MRRPEGVTITAIWFYITTVGCVFGLSGMAIGFLGLWTSGTSDGIILGTMGMMVGVMAIATTGIAHAVVGWGLWTLKPWARSAAMVLAIFQTPLIAGIIILIYFAKSKEAKRAFGIPVPDPPANP